MRREEMRGEKRRGEEEKRVNRARLARIGKAAGRDVRDSGVRALIIHTSTAKQRETHTRTHTLCGHLLCTISSRALPHPPDCCETPEEAPPDSRFAFCALYLRRIPRKHDVHEQQTASFRHASQLTWAQVHNSALELGGDQKSMSAGSTGKRAPKLLRFSSRVLLLRARGGALEAHTPP